LKDASERALDADGVARELTAKLDRVPGVQVFVQNPPTIRIGGRQSKALYQFTMQGTDLKALYAGAAALEARLRASPSLADVTSTTGAAVPLASVTTANTTVGPLSVNHSGQVPSATLSFNLREGVSLGAGTAEVEREARTALPATIATQFSGTAQAFQDSQAGLGLLLVLAVLVIYGILAILYESFIHPVTILSGLPFAVFGALGALLITGQELTLYAFVGLVLLVGIVKKNAIMMVDFAVE